MHRVIFMLLVLLLPIGQGFGQSALRLADKQFEMGSFQNALTKYEEALEDQPDEQDIVARIAQCYVQLDDNLNAATTLEKIIEREDLNPEYLFLYARTLQSLRLFGKAKFYFLKYAEQYPAIGTHFAKGCDFAREQIKSPEEYQLENLLFNTTTSEFGSSIKGDRMIWSSFRTDIPKTRKVNNRMSKMETGGSQLFTTSLRNDGQMPAYVLNPITDGQNIGPASFSHNGKWVAYTKNAFRDDQRLFNPYDENMSLYIAEIDRKGNWENDMPFPYNSNTWATGYPFLSNDGKVLYFASTRPGGYGGFDLYVSYRDGKDWSEPINLGSAINTRGHEIAPSFEGGTLYFSSDWHIGMGGFDVFKSEQKDGMWSTVYHMGNGVNSAKDDLFYHWDPSDQKAYFTSNRMDGIGQYDIYSAVPLYEEMRLNVMDKSTSRPVPEAIVTFEGMSKQHLTDASGKLLVRLPKSGIHSMMVGKEGYHSIKMQVDPGSPSSYEIFIEKDVTTVVDAKAEKIEEKPKADKNVKKSGDPLVKPKEMKVKPAEDFASVYSIQVAAISPGKYRAEEYADLGLYGKVMPVDAGQITRVRVGPYPDERAARRALEGIRSTGYTDAFIVRPENPSGSITKPAAPVMEKPVEKTIMYKVRLATYSRPEYFEPERVEHLGRIEEFTKGKWTIMLLGDYDTLREAERVLRQAKAAGFEDAHISTLQNGVLRRVQ